MKNKFPIILLVLFTIFAIIKIAFTNSMIYMEKKDYTTFEQTIGEDRKSTRLNSSHQTSRMPSSA